MSLYRQSDCIDYVCGEIIRMQHPQKIILYNQRLDSHENTYSFKLCVVVDTPDADKTLEEIYTQVDCEIPYDILLYTSEEWEMLTQQPTSFATQIQDSGKVLYE
ncbi:hypothetical protein U6B65_10925 [Oscillospiraceae bacterium MB08-C2-2]|nr:hypothetical protein U6B65_10925 [Oscillospiraceae bacterium MB08-C2-2]